MLFVLFSSSIVNAQNMVMVGGESMSPQKDIFENAVNSQAHTRFGAGVKAADLVEILKGHGPFTVLAPTNEAFENLSDSTEQTLLKPENKNKLGGILTYHVIPCNLRYNDIANAIE